MNNVYTREEFNQRRLAAKQAIRSDSIFAAVTSVFVGLGSLGFLQWINPILTRPERIVESLAIFGFFIIIFGWMLIDLKKTSHQAVLTYPQCNTPLEGDTERIAAATSRCKKCGGLVIAE